MKARHFVIVLAAAVFLQSCNGDVLSSGRQKCKVFQIDVSRDIGNKNCLPKYGLREFRCSAKTGNLISRSTSESNLARNVIQGTITKIKHHLRTFTHKHAVRIESLQGTTGKRSKWFQFPRGLSRETIKRFAHIFQYAVVGLIGVELILIVRDVLREIWDSMQVLSYDDETHSGGRYSGGSGKALSRDSVQNLISWLNEPEDTRQAPPHTIGPTWILLLAQEIYKCSHLSLEEVQRILLQLSNAEAKLLQSCLLSSNKVNLDEVGGLFRAKFMIDQLLVSSLSDLSAPFRSPANKSCPYEKMISKRIGSHNLVLWGPPGSGKSHLTRAIATQLGLPTLAVTPTLIRNCEKLETLFSLISTLGSCVVVLDDLDGLFTNRGYEEGDGSREIKTEFLQWWDDVSSRPGSNHFMFTVAATSRPWDVDTAAWRRFPNRIYIGLPNSEDRYDILKKFSKDLPPINESVLQYFVSVTEGFVPMDLYQILVHACQIGPMARQDMTLTINDVHEALSMILPTRFSAQYTHQLQNFVSSHISVSEASTAPSSGAQKYFSPNVIQSFPVCENGYCWETVIGKFYQFQIPVDPEILEAIQTILLYSFEWNSGDDLDFSEDDDDDDELDT